MKKKHSARLLISPLDESAAADLRFCGGATKMVALLPMNERYINHWLDDGKWRGHDWNYWRDMLPYYLSRL